MEALRGNSCPEGLSTVQVLVALLRALGLRARLVLTLKPLPFKQSAKVQGVASVVVGVATCSSSEECAVKEQLLMEKGCPDQPIILLSSVASCSSSKTNQEGCPVLNGSGKSLACGRQRGRGQKRTRLSPEEEGGGEASKGYKGKGKKPKKDDEPRPPTAKEVTEEVLTPVASKKLKGGGGRRMKKDATPPPTERKRTLRSNSKICSTDVAEGQGGGAEDQGGGANEDEGEDDDISIVMSPKGKRKRRLVPSHRDSVVEGEGPTPHPCGGEGPTPHPCGGEGPTPHPCGGEGSTPHPCDPTGGEVTAHLYGEAKQCGRGSVGGTYVVGARWAGHVCIIVTLVTGQTQTTAGQKCTWRARGSGCVYTVRPPRWTAPSCVRDTPPTHPCTSLA